MRHAGVLTQREKLSLGRLLGGEPAVELVPADVVGPALDERHLDGTVKGGRDGFQQPGEVPAHDLGLQGKGGRGDEGGFVADQRMGDQRNEVRQGLSGAGSGLDQQVVAAVDSARHLPGHLVLAAAALSAHTGNRPVEQFDDELLAGGTAGFSGPGIRHC